MRWQQSDFRLVAGGWRSGLLGARDEPEAGREILMVCPNGCNRVNAAPAPRTSGTVAVEMDYVSSIDTGASNEEGPVLESLYQCPVCKAIKVGR